jgi:alpha-glucosidase
MSKPDPRPAASGPWWRRAVVYQVYIRSFADGDGDGVGDIAGICSRLPYLAELGVDAIWINPWYPSPMADGGYDVADYRAIEPAFGTLEQAEALVEAAHRLGLRVILDIVPNHTSHLHAWFREALVAAPGSPERERYLFRDGREGGSLPPNDWRSVFGGPAWTRVNGAGAPGQWYLHLFAPEQPDLNWANPEVRAEFESILRFWFERGVDGFRIDVAHGLVKDAALPDLGYDTLAPGESPVRLLRVQADGGHPHWDSDEVHEIYRGWRCVADEFEGRAFVAEAWVATPERLALYVRSRNLHTAFNFDFLKSPWQTAALRRVIDRTIDALGAVGAPSTWVLSSHDATRHVTRYGRVETGAEELQQELGLPSDVALGTRRARAAALLALALPGGAYVYQGEELGLWQVEDLPEELLQDPTWERSGRTLRGRDGCRVPLPWSGEEPPFGFGPPGSQPWLPQPPAWRAFSVEAETGDPVSMLELYRSALRLRREHPGLAGEHFAWLAAGPEVLLFERGPGFRCAVNLGAEPYALPAGCRLLLASDRGASGVVPSDGAAWFEPAARQA